MKQRHHQLLELLSRKEWVKGREIAACLGVSTRTIRSDIEHINQEMPHIIRADKQRGYHLQALQPNRYESTVVHQNIPKDHEERSTFLLKQLLFQEEGISVVDFCKSCFVSAKTFEGDRLLVQERLREYEGLSLEMTQQKLQLKGDESSKRQLYRDLLKSELNEDFLNVSELRSIYPELDMEQIQKSVWHILQMQEYAIRATMMPFLLLHIGVVLQRLLAGQMIKEVNSKAKRLVLEEDIAQHIFKAILPKNEKVPNGEIQSFAKLLKAYHNSEELQSEVLFRGESVELEEIIEQVVQQLYHIAGISFVDEKEFMVRLKLHLQGFLERVEMNLKLPNGYVQSFKRQYPLIFDTAVSVSQSLKAALGCEMTEEEIGFIALHIGAAYMQGVKDTKIKTLLIANCEYPLIANSVMRLKEQFGHRLEFVAEQSLFSPALLEFYPCDLVITFDETELFITVPSIKLSLFFNPQDEIRLITIINSLESKQLSARIRMQMVHYMDEKFFYADVEATTPKLLLEEMSQKLYQNGIVTESFLISVLERESLSSTDFDYALAIPHPLHPHSHQSMVSIAVLKEPIQWSHYPVKLVILLALREEEMEFMQLFLRWLGKQLDSPEKMIPLIEAKNVQSFIEAIR